MSTTPKGENEPTWLGLFGAAPDIDLLGETCGHLSRDITGGCFSCAAEQRTREAQAQALHEVALLIEQTPAEDWREPLVAGESPGQGLYNGANAAIRFATRVLRERAHQLTSPSGDGR